MEIIIVNIFKKIEVDIKKEKRAIIDSKEEINAKNIQIIKAITLGCTLILGSSFISTFFMSFIDDAGFDGLKWAYLFLVICSFLAFLYITFFKVKHVTALIYLVNSLAFLYSCIVSSLVTYDKVSVTFIVVLFLITTSYIEEGWRINIFATVSTLLYIYIISFYKTPQAFNAEIVNSTTVLALSFIIGTIVRDARLESFIAKRSLQKQVYKDHLTNINNRRKFFEDLGSALAVDEVNGIKAFSILDIDNFKLYNDTYGHQVGDICLKKIGKVFSEIENDKNVSFYRYGGEEFVISYFGKTKDEIKDILTYTVKKIKDLGIEHKSSKYGIVTVSIGTTFIEEVEKGKFEELLTKSDIALYLAKENGRNRLEFFDDNMLKSNNAMATKFRKR